MILGYLKLLETLEKDPAFSGSHWAALCTFSFSQTSSHVLPTALDVLASPHAHLQCVALLTSACKHAQFRFRTALTLTGCAHGLAALRAPLAQRSALRTLMTLSPCFMQVSLSYAAMSEDGEQTRICVQICSLHFTYAPSEAQHSEQCTLTCVCD